MIRKIRLHRMMISGACLLLVSCSGLLNSDRPATRTFILTPYPVEHSVPAALDRHELTVLLSVIPGLDSDQLLTLSADGELNHFSGARWPDYLPEFAGSLIRRSVQNTAVFSNVSDGRDSGKDNCELKLELQQFCTLLNGNGRGSSVQISMSGHFFCEDKSTPVSLTASAPVYGLQIESVVSAHQQALDQLMRELMAQLNQLLSQAEAP